MPIIAATGERPWKYGKWQNLAPYARILGILHNERKRFVIPVQLRRADRATIEVEVLIDSSAEVNLITPILAKKLNWTSIADAAITVRGIDGRPITSYGLYQDEVSAADSLGREQKLQCTFHSISSDEHSLVLGYP
jgi:hypothetical protein